MGWPLAPGWTIKDGKPKLALVVEAGEEQMLVVTETQMLFIPCDDLVKVGDIEGPLKVKGRVVEQVARLLEDPCDIKRSAAAEMLFLLGRDMAEKPVANRLRSKEPSVRRLAVKLLGDMKTKNLEPLVELKSDQDEQVRKHAVRAAAHIGGQEALSFCLDRARNDPAPSVRREAILRLGDCGDLEITPDLIEIAQDLEEDSHLREVAIRALSRLTRKPYGDDLERWRSWWESREERETR
jgi:HEAT repeat protein